MIHTPMSYTEASCYQMKGRAVVISHPLMDFILFLDAAKLISGRQGWFLSLELTNAHLENKAHLFHSDQ